jgi:hypothetical protein
LYPTVDILCAAVVSRRTNRALLTVQVDRLLLDILYCNMVLESVLSDAALLRLCTEILKEKKVQPVGEVGKMLSEITSATNMSGGLKEKFGGLKKFLEHYTARFVFSSDHPFNPCVALRSVLEDLHLEVGDNGVKDLQQMVKNRKVRTSNSHRTSADCLHCVSSLCFIRLERRQAPHSGEHAGHFRA